MLKVGFVGWRGMVGSVLMERMLENDDFKGIDPLFFTTSQVGQKGPDIGREISVLQDAYDLDSLSEMDVIVSCQGGDYTKKVHGEIREKGWNGYWLDAASTLRMVDSSIIVLDPVNKKVIEDSLKKGVKDYVGGNCTVSLMLMAIGGLFEVDCIEWLTSMTYQAASGAGAKNMRELIMQMAAIAETSKEILSNERAPIAKLDKAVAECMRGKEFPVVNFGAPLAGSLIPWIDVPLDSGQTKEEWKGCVETNKILQTEKEIPIDGVCVRIGTMRCHSQAITIKLKRDLSIEEITELISNHNDWVKIVPNSKEETLKELSPAAVTGTLNVPVGRIKKLNSEERMISLFTVGDQLLWGAAEPIRRMLGILKDFA